MSLLSTGLPRACLLGTLLTGIAAADDWPQFRGPNGSGLADTSNLPSKFGPAKNVVWKTALPPGHSSPVLTEDRIFVTAYKGETLFTICLNRADGKILWRREAPRPRKEVFDKTHGPASPTPVTDGENVYVFFGDFGLLSYGPDGNERWRVPLGPFVNINGHGASPILADGIVILICDQDIGSYMIAVNQSDGSEVWKIDRPEVPRNYATPGVYRPQGRPAELIVPGAYVLISYDLKTGEKLWWVRGMAWQLKSVPVIKGDTIYVSGWEAGGSAKQLAETPPFHEFLAKHDANKDGFISPQEHPNPKMLDPVQFTRRDLDDDGRLDRRDWQFWRARLSSQNSLSAIRPSGARGDLTDTHVLWRHKKSLPNTPSPLLHEGVVYLVKDGGIVTSLDAETGRVLKQGRIKEAIEKYWASPVAADGKLYTVSEGCAVSVLKPGHQWEVLAVNRLDDQCFATPAIADGRIYLRTMSTLYCFGK